MHNFHFSCKGGNATCKANSSGNEKKGIKSSGTIVKSRYLQSAEKTLSKSSSSNNESMGAPQRPASPKPKPKVGTPQGAPLFPKLLQPVSPSSQKMSLPFCKVCDAVNFSDGHCLRPDFDISVIKGIMESNTAKLRVEAETRIVQELEEEEVLRIEVLDKKRQYELKEKNRLLSELLDLQIASLTPLAEAATQFTEEYKSFAAAVDTTRHELPVKNFHMVTEQRDFLDKAESCLGESEKLFKECTHGNTLNNCASLKYLKSIKTASKDIGKELTGTFSELLELSSLICQQTILHQQAAEEEQLGAARTHKLFCYKQ
ncbi:hypothetical protein WMY93_024504 [Mugilogobius chulae]|uniref:HAUS augmin-like complex subunit 8 n=1 Tax=Mugilogobius chulae TaxID=88201 RepID=A0AAW0NBR5_9GOBI